MQESLRWKEVAIIEVTSRLLTSESNTHVYSEKQILQKKRFSRKATISKVRCFITLT